MKRIGNKSWRIPNSSVSGCLACVIATMATTPCDVIRTRMMTHAAEAGMLNINLFGWILKTIKEEGLFRGMFKGWQYRIVQGIVEGTLYYTVYDQILKALGVREAYRSFRN